MSLFSDKTYENLMEEALSKVKDIYDKREGSMIFNGNAPCLAEMSQVYTAIDYLLETTYIHSSPREFLIKRAKDHSIYPYEATQAVFKAEFNIDVPMGTRFSVEDLNFSVREKCIEDERNKEDTAIYFVECETPGKLANDYSGKMIPIEYVNGLAKANLLECAIPGEDEEETEAFRARVIEALKSIAFGGNRADYRNWVLKIPGVEAVKVYPVWNENIAPSELIPDETVKSWYEETEGSLNNDVRKWLSAVFNLSKKKKLTVGGTVKLVIMGADGVTTSKLVNTVQEEIDPVENAGEGKGIAPIGHIVNVFAVQEKEISIETKVVCKNCAFEKIKESIKTIISDYFNKLKGEWEKTENLVVRISHIESSILNELSEYVEDIGETKINGKAENYVMEEDSIPILKDVINTEG